MPRSRVRTLIRYAAIPTALLALCGAVPTASAAGDGTGPQPTGLGMGSRPALAQPTCAENGHTSFNAVGVGPFCVNPWPAGKKNGGATASGVTATSVKVVAYVPNDQMIAAGTGDRAATNLATDAPATPAAALVDMGKVYEHAAANGTYQLWGRTPEIEIVTASGPDEASQRADALEVIDRQPFMVVDMTRFTTGGAPAFAATVAARKILTVSTSTTPELAAKSSPYRWNQGADSDASILLTPRFLARSLAGERARWAGDDELRAKKRAFGVVYPTSNFDLAAFEAALRASGGPAIVEAVGYDPADTSAFPRLVPTLISRLKESGTTSVVLFADNSVVAPLTTQATALDFWPEWVFTGYGYHEHPLFARSYDQEQMRQAFGAMVLYPTPDTVSAPPYLRPFSWYWGPETGNYWSVAPSLYEFLYSALHYAGPELTAQNVKKGLFAVPAQGGAATGTSYFQRGFGKTVGMPYDEYANTGTDRSLAWYDPDARSLRGSANEGVGVFMYLDEGRRYSYRDFPSTEPPFFTPERSVSSLPLSSQYEDGVLPAPAPCAGCPSSGSSAS